MPGWYVANGLASTPDMIDKFVRGEDEAEDTGGADTHQLTEAEMPAHVHPPLDPDNIAFMTRDTTSPTDQYNTTNTNMAHNDATTGSTGGDAAHNNIPAYFSVIFIVKMEPFTPLEFTPVISQQVRDGVLDTVPSEDAVFDYAEPLIPKSRVRAIRNGVDQSIPNATWTKVELTTVDWDGLGEFDNITNYRFTALNAGYYQVNAQLRMLNIANDTQARCAIYKNGVGVGIRFVYSYNGNHDPMPTVSDMVYLDVDDYLELYVYHTDGAASDLDGPSQYTFMSVHLLSKA